MMEVQLLLQGNPTYQWYNADDIWFLGYFFDGNNVLYRDEDAIKFISENLENSTLSELCRAIDGRFSILIKKEGYFAIASDALNYFPIFYTNDNQSVKVSDNWNFLVEQQDDFRLNSSAIPEFKNAGFVLLNETLAEGIFKTNANQILEIKDSGMETTAYQNFIEAEFSSGSAQDLEVEAEVAMMLTAQRLKKFLNGRMAVVPLSGGFDSRLIVSMLHRVNYKNVLCFTYGKQNAEVPISKKVAEILGYPWVFVKFDANEVDDLKNPEFLQYLQYAASGFAMPYLMEYYALKTLKQKSKISDDAVFLPGHSGDFLGGSYVLKTVKNKLKFEELPKFITEKYFIFSKTTKNEKQQITNRIAKEFLKKTNRASDQYNRNIEDWDVQEKLSKFIFRSSHVFTFFNYEVYFPLWDQPLRRFFQKVPYQFRERKMLYDNVLETRFFLPQNISFSKEEISYSRFQIYLQKLKDQLRYFFPWKMVLKRINAADWPNYQLLTKEMKQELERESGEEFKDFKNYNAVIAKWYLLFLKRRS